MAFECNMNILRDFVSEEQREFKFKIGSIIASGLAGFMAGLVVASIIWMVGLYLTK